jgi:GTPase SAR1 family protein
METNTQYQSYVADLKNLNTTSARRKVQNTFSKNFEKIYDKAEKSKLNLENAKSFLQNLSKSELNTIQGYSGLADSINVDALSSEGAYNLLMHDNQKYDFNNDGVVENGQAKGLAIVPKTMPHDVRVAYISALNSLSDEDRLMSMTIAFDWSARIIADANHTTYKPATIDYNYLKNRVDDILHPKNGAYSSEEFKASIRNFWDAFEKSYTTPQTQKSEDKSDISVEKFMKELREKGAYGFLNDLNKKKIDDLVKEFKDKLIKELGSSAQSAQIIDKEVKAFRKQLLEKLEESMDKSKNKTIDTQILVKTLLNMKRDDTTKLQDLLAKRKD